MEEPTEKFRRLSPLEEVRLRFGYIVKCTKVIKDGAGNIVELRGSYDPATKSGSDGSNRKVKGTIHWVSAKHAMSAELRLYSHLFTVEVPDAADDFLEMLSPDSLRIENAFVEPVLGAAEPGTHWQFERRGYFFVDPVDSSIGEPVFNRVVGLRDGWSKQVKPVISESSTSKSASGEQGATTVRALSPEQQEVFERLARRGLADGEARVLAVDTDSLAFFESAAHEHANPAGVAKWVVNVLLREVKQVGWQGLKLEGPQLGALVAMVDRDEISNSIARKVFEQMLEEGGRPDAIVAEKGLAQVSDSKALEAIIDQVTAGNPDEVLRYKEGNKRLIGFLIGQVMKATKGQANAGLVRQLLLKKLG
jgi:glutaminyl-tRNA synthetase